MDNNKQAISWVLAANVIWGVSPLYWKLLHDSPSERILLHRALWSAVFLLALIAKNRSGFLLEVLKSKKTAIAVITSSILLATNWHTYLWAISEDRVLEASLGYFLLPLFNIILGAVFLKERISRRQQVALAIIASAVALKVFLIGVFPWIALVLGASFAGYILIRKVTKPCPIGALFYECNFIVLSAIALSYFSGGLADNSFWGENRAENIYLLASGAITVIPMIMLLRAAPKVSMQCMGMASYLLPTLMWLVAVTAFGEPLIAQDLICLAGIWIGVFVFFKRKTPDHSIRQSNVRISPLERNSLLPLEGPQVEAI